jgi:hypothetical protein
VVLVGAAAVIGAVGVRRVRMRPDGGAPVGPGTPSVPAGPAAGAAARAQAQAPSQCAGGFSGQARSGPVYAAATGTGSPGPGHMPVAMHAAAGTRA